MSMQVMVPKSTEVTQMQHNMHQAASAQHAFETMRRKADDKLKEQQVRGKDNAEEEKVRDEGDRDGRGGYYPGSGGGKKNPSSAELAGRLAVDPNRGRNLDISL
ncbi:MAG: hypothetical protein IJ849_00835 [Selenomonadaceae bacterium]|nr:hypothetical protein [Selenomonadaceae bacterium]